MLLPFFQSSVLELGSPLLLVPSRVAAAEVQS